MKAARLESGGFLNQGQKLQAQQQAIDMDGRIATPVPMKVTLSYRFALPAGSARPAWITGRAPESFDVQCENHLREGSRA